MKPSYPSLRETPRPVPDASGDSSETISIQDKNESGLKPTKWQRISHVLLYTPRRSRYDPANPPKFSTGLNFLFAFAGAFTVANLYYNHPILHLLAEEFNVSNERASLIPTLAQAGYASGLLFLCPLGDYIVFILLWLFMPDYPSANPEGISYFRILWSILTIFIRHPLLIQAGLVGFCTSTTFTNFWTTLTFLLSGPTYEYSTLVIGLFALIGIFSMLFTPFWCRYVTDSFIPLFSVVLGLSFSLTGTIIGTYTGSFAVAGPIIQALFLDFGIQTAQVANRSAIYSILPQARNRINTAYMMCVFTGQLTGTAVGNHVYAMGGWVRSGSVSVGFLGAAIGLCVLRGPREKGWIGWSGGWAVRKDGEKKVEMDEEKGSREGQAGTMEPQKGEQLQEKLATQR
ncbi:MAG: hypothetical protein Q9219_001889 [cf. Caloplaca sp. 3 TL-2023]